MKHLFCFYFLFIFFTRWIVILFSKEKNDEIVDTDEKKEVEEKKFTFGFHEFDNLMGILDSGV